MTTEKDRDEIDYSPLIEKLLRILENTEIKLHKEHSEPQDEFSEEQRSTPTDR